MESGGDKVPSNEIEIYKQMLHKMETYVLKRTLKVIHTDLEELINTPGCDASNMYDEEVL